MIADVEFPRFLLETDFPHKSSNRQIPRRDFLKVSGAAGGGLILAFCLGTTPKAKGAEAEANRDASIELNAYIQIKPDGSVIIFATNPEVGQGIKTALPMIVAEELDVDWQQVEVRQSPIDAVKYGRQAAGGSMSVATTWDRLRKAGATARVMLIQAAAEQWKVSPKTCQTEHGMVEHVPSKRLISYGDLAELAREIEVPAPDAVPLKDRSDYKLLGKRITGVDNRQIVTGESLFGIDMQLPGMLHAVFVKCPAVGGKVKSANLTSVKKLPGVNDAFVIIEEEEQLASGVAILANSSWSAFKAKETLEVIWDTSEAINDSWPQLVEEAAKKADEAGETVHEQGDIEAAFTDAQSTVDAYYTYPFLSHATLEPQNCTAWIHDGKLEIWAPTQTPQAHHEDFARLAGVPKENVVLHQRRIGGGFGRRLMNDFVFEAVAIAKRTDAPVKLTWTREDDMGHDFYRVGGFHKLKGCIDAEGKVIAWDNHFVSFTEGGEDPKPVRGGGSRGQEFPCVLIPNTRLRQTLLPLGIPTGWWRAPGSCSLAWVLQSFLHELSEAASKDHVEFLLDLLGEPRWLEEGNRWMLNTGRAIDVVKLAAKKGDWGQPMPKGHGRGIAFYFCHMGHFAEVAEVSVNSKNKVKLNRVVVAGDVGLIINRSGAENQIEGSVIDGWSTMLGQEITFESGRVKQSNFHDYPLLRMPDHPKVEVHLIESDFPPTGLGEPALPPLAPAVCNAIFDATGKRVRTLPLTKEGFSI